jgi:hypothetical protein
VSRMSRLATQAVDEIVTHLRLQLNANVAIANTLRHRPPREYWDAPFDETARLWELLLTDVENGRLTQLDLAQQTARISTEEG